MLCSSLHIAEVSPAPVVVHFRGIPRKRHQSPCALAMYNQHPTSGRRCKNRAHRATYPCIITLQDHWKQHVAKDFQNIPMDFQNIQTRKTIIFYALGWSSPHDLHGVRDGCEQPHQKGSITRTFCWLRELSCI